MQGGAMKNHWLEGLVIVALFLFFWLSLSRVNWVQIFQVEKISDKTEEKLGELIYETISTGKEEITDTLIVNSLDTIVNRLCENNDIDKSKIKLHILQTEEVNAFALPDAHLVVYSGLIDETHNPEELSGVIAHELGHIELRHVMKKLMKELGLTMLLSAAGGSGGPEMMRETAKVLSSRAFDRSFEKEADLMAREYLIASEIDPEPFSHFLYRLGDEMGDMPDYFTWMSTHPEPKERAHYLAESYSIQDSNSFSKVLHADNWDSIQNWIQNN